MSNGAILPLRLAEVSFIVRGRTIIDRVSLDIETGPSTIILGANGAGKSVLMRLMHGLLSPTSGRIGWNAPERPGGPRKQAMVFQRPVMLRRSALANVIYALASAGISRRLRNECAADLLDQVGLANLAGRPARKLTGGEQQRLALARALAREPDILFLDEPTASLDPASTKAVEDIITDVAGRGVKVVMATHDLGEARRLAGDVVFLSKGRLVEHSPAPAFFTYPATEAARRFLAGDLVL